MYQTQTMTDELKLGSNYHRLEINSGYDVMYIHTYKIQNLDITLSYSISRNTKIKYFMVLQAQLWVFYAATWLHNWPLNFMAISMYQ